MLKHTLTCVYKPAFTIKEIREYAVFVKTSTGAIRIDRDKSLAKIKPEIVDAARNLCNWWNFTASSDIYRILDIYHIIARIESMLLVYDVTNNKMLNKIIKLAIRVYSDDY